MPARTNYNKKEVLEYIFKRKFDPIHLQKEIPFTRSEVREAINATGGTPPDNLNNFMKDLVRSGNHHPRSDSAAEAGYKIMEGTHRGEMGVFFHAPGADASSICVSCPDNLCSILLNIKLPHTVADLVRPDEGGLISVLDYGHVIDAFLGVPARTVKRVQAPVKIQPYELDGFFVLLEDKHRVAIACEAKSKGRDVITLNQIVGIAEATLKGLLQADMSEVIPMGAKIMPNGDIFLVAFQRCTSADLPHLKDKLRASTIAQQARFSLQPKPAKW